MAGFEALRASSFPSMLCGMHNIEDTLDPIAPTRNSTNSSNSNARVDFTKLAVQLQTGNISTDTVLPMPAHYCQSVGHGRLWYLARYHNPWTPRYHSARAVQHWASAEAEEKEFEDVFSPSGRRRTRRRSSRRTTRAHVRPLPCTVPAASMEPL